MLSTGVDTAAVVEWYCRNRARTEAIFDLIDPAAYYSRPIALRNPIVFYEGHLPAFSVLAFLRRGLGHSPVDARLEKLFERGIDPEDEASAVPRSGASTMWPSRDEVRAFARACDEAVLDALKADAAPTEGLYTALEHEAMHQETLLYMWHRLPYELKRRPPAADGRWALADGRWPMADGRSSMDDGRRPVADERTDVRSVTVPGGEAVLGAARGSVVFGWDNEFDQHRVDVPSFDIDALPITNAQFMEFVNDGGYATRAWWSDEGWAWIEAEEVRHPAFWVPSNASPVDHRPSVIVRRASAIAHRPSPIESWRWRGMFEALPLTPDAPVHVGQAEAAAYARWKGRRLMTEAEFHRAAEGASPGHVDFAGFDPIPVGAHPESASRWGVHDLIGNGWEWTSTVFAPFDGFTPMRSYPEYSADFFDGRHYVMKGGSQATARELLRPSFRNWFRANYPYVYAKFRTVADVR
ncbi:MAG: SUMF1/EgtB/PvdO family nonheme iron enzyme [Vicinamibacterales bacterium]